MPLNKETKPNQTKNKMISEIIASFFWEFLNILVNVYANEILQIKK